MLHFTAVNDSRLTDADVKKLRARQELLESLRASMAEMKSKALEAVGHFKNADPERALATATEALAMDWEGGLKADPEGVKPVLLAALRVYLRLSGPDSVEKINDLFEALEIFPDELEFWRALLEAVDLAEGVNPLAISAVWEAVNDRIIVPERLDIRCKALYLAGELGEAKALADRVGIDFEAVKAKCTVEPAEEHLPEAKFSISAPSGAQYCHLLLKQYELYMASSRGSLDSLLSPMIVEVKEGTSQSSQPVSSQPDSFVQSDTSPVTSPMKRKRSARQASNRKRSHDEGTVLGRAKQISLLEVLREVIPNVGSQIPVEEEEAVRSHLKGMNESKECFVDRVLGMWPILLKAKVDIKSARGLLKLAFYEFGSRDANVIRMLAEVNTTLADEELLEALATIDAEALLAVCSHFSGSKSLFVADPIHALCGPSRELAEKLDVKGIDYRQVLDSPQTPFDLKERLCFALVSTRADELLALYHQESWLPVEECIHHSQALDPAIAADLLLGTGSDDCDTSVRLLWLIAKSLPSSAERITEYLDSRSMLFGGKAYFPRLALTLALQEPSQKYTWALLRAMYRLPPVVRASEWRFYSEASSKIDPCKEHLLQLSMLLEWIWDNDALEVNEQEFEQAVSWVASKSYDALSPSTKRIIDSNDGAFKQLMSLPSSELTSKLSIPSMLSLPRVQEAQAYIKALELLVGLQLEHFPNKKRSPEWLHGHKRSVKSLLLSIPSPGMYEQLGVCLSARLRLLAGALEPEGCAKHLPKLKRQIKRAFICMRVSGSEKDCMLPVLELMLCPGLLQFTLSPGPRATLMSLYIRLLTAKAYDAKGDWRPFYLLAEAVGLVEPAACLKPLLIALDLAGADLDAQTLVYDLFLSARERLSPRLSAALRPELSTITAESLIRQLEKAPSSHRLLCKAATDAATPLEAREGYWQQILPFIGKPRASGMAHVRPGPYDRIGDAIYFQELYARAAIEHYTSLGNAQAVLQIGQRIRSSGASHCGSWEALVVLAAKSLLSLREQEGSAVTAEDLKKTLSFFKDLRSEGSLALAALVQKTIQGQ